MPLEIIDCLGGEGVLGEAEGQGGGLPEGPVEGPSCLGTRGDLISGTRYYYRSPRYMIHSDTV